MKNRTLNCPSGALPRAGHLLLCLGLCGGLTGCFGFLKPAQSTAKQFVLSPTAVAGPSSTAQNLPSLGLGQVKVPPYLFNSSLAVRRGTNEIEYLTSALWAERLDAGLQRVLAADLAVLLPTDRIFVSTWQKEDVTLELYVAIEQFEVDSTGQAVLLGRWRILSPGGERILNAGRTKLVRRGPPPVPDASGSVEHLSELAGDFSRQLAQIINETRVGDAKSASSIPTKP